MKRTVKAPVGLCAGLATLLGIAACGSTRATPAGEAGSPSQASPERCRGLSDCPYGFHCEGATCVEAACHPAGADGELAERSCPRGQTCEWEDESGAFHGVGDCAPHDDPSHVDEHVERIEP